MLLQNKVAVIYGAAGAVGGTVARRHRRTNVRAGGSAAVPDRANLRVDRAGRRRHPHCRRPGGGRRGRRPRP